LLIVKNKILISNKNENCSILTDVIVIYFGKKEKNMVHLRYHREYMEIVLQRLGSKLMAVAKFAFIAIFRDEYHRITEKRYV
jgi:hypothetical protein